MDAAQVISRLRSASGQGLVELTIAMSILAVGVSALMAVLVSGAVAVQRTSERGTATALADKQLELFRTLGFANIQLDSGCINSFFSYNNGAVAACGYAANDPSLTNPGSADPYFAGVSVATSGLITNARTTGVPLQQIFGTCTAPASHPECLPTQVVPKASSPDHRTYRVDTYVTSSTTSGRQTKQVIVVVRDPTRAGKPIIATDASSFDQSGTATG